MTPPSPAAVPASALQNESRSSQYQQSLSERMQTDICFRCKLQGHWARDCPLSTPKKPSSSSTPIINGHDSPPQIHCRCGAGLCFIRTSRTEKNPFRKFYSCPSARSCEFFRWCDEVTHEEINFSPNVSNPMCPCGAGPCLKRTEEDGPNAGRRYFGCAVERGFGACEFIQWEDTQVDTTPIGPGDDNRGYSSPQSTWNNHQVFSTVNEKDFSRKCNLRSEHQERMEFESPVMDNPPHSLSLEMVHIFSKKDKEMLLESQKHDKASDISSPDLEKEYPISDSTNGDLILEEAEPWYPMMEKAPQGLGLLSASSVHCRQKEFLRQIYAAADVRTEGDQILGLHFLGWLGRLLFPPFHCLKDPPPKPIYCCVFPSYDPIIVPQDVVMCDTVEPSLFKHSLKVADPEKAPLETPQQDSQPFSGALLGLVGHKRSLGTIQNDVLKALERTAMHFRNELVTLLDSMDPLDQDKLLWAARDISTVMHGLLVDHGPFAERLNEFFQCASRFAETELSFQDFSSVHQELTEQYIAEKIQFDDISRKHAEAQAAFTASGRQLKWLREEASRVKEMVLLIEKRLTSCEAETSELEIRVSAISKDLLESERSMQAAIQRVAESSKIYERKDAERSAAKAAFEKLFGSPSELCKLHIRKRQKH